MESIQPALPPQPQILLTLSPNSAIEVQHNMVNPDAGALQRALTQMLAAAILRVTQEQPAEPARRILVATGGVPVFNGR